MNTRRDNTDALNAFIEEKIAIDALLERIAAASAEHFDRHPDEINFGDVGNLGRLRQQLQEASDALFGEGEYAE